MDKTQKTTITLGPIEIAKIDLLVDNLLYSSRSDFIRDAVRAHLKSFDEDIQGLIDAQHKIKSEEIVVLGGIGVISFSQAELIDLETSNKKADLVVVGMLYLSKDIDLDLVKRTIRKVKVYGKINAAADVKKYLVKLSTGNNA